MIVNFRRLFFAALFFCFAHILCAGEDEDTRLNYRFEWPDVEYAFRYEVLIEKEEEDGEYRNELQEFSDESFFDVLLMPGDYRLCVIPYDIFDRPGKGSDWKNFKVIAATETDAELQFETADADPMPEEEPVEEQVFILSSENPMEKTARIPLAEKPVKVYPEWFIAAFAEGIGYARYNTAFGGGLAAGGSLNGKGFGISLLYAQDEEDFISLEMLAHLRLYLSRVKNNTGFFLQAEGGIVLFAHEEFEIKNSIASFAGGVRAGWRFPMGRRLYIEPAVRAGYPYILGGDLSIGIKF